VSLGAELEEATLLAPVHVIQELHVIQEQGLRDENASDPSISLWFEQLVRRAMEIAGD
jgi:hypothetical protein